MYLTHDADTAALLLDKAITGCLGDEVAEIRSLGETLARWRSEILAHHRTGASNGPTEGLNLLVKDVKRCGIEASNGSSTTDSESYSEPADPPGHTDQHHPPCERPVPTSTRGPLWRSGHVQHGARFRAAVGGAEDVAARLQFRRNQYAVRPGPRHGVVQNLEVRHVQCRLRFLAVPVGSHSSDGLTDLVDEIEVPTMAHAERAGECDVDRPAHLNGRRFNSDSAWPWVGGHRSRRS